MMQICSWCRYERERESCTCSNLQEGGCRFYIPQPSNQLNVCDLISSNLCVILYFANWCSYFLPLAARLATVYRGCFIYLFLSTSSIYHSQCLWSYLIKLYIYSKFMFLLPRSSRSNSSKCTSEYRVCVFII